MWPVLKGLSLCCSEGQEKLLKLDRNKELSMGRRMECILPKSCCDWLRKAAGAWLQWEWWGDIF